MSESAVHEHDWDYSRFDTDVAIHKRRTCAVCGQSEKRVWVKEELREHGNREWYQ